MPEDRFEDLNARFAIPGHVSFATGPGDLPIVIIHTPYADSTIALQGANVINFQPIGHEPLLWRSTHSFYAMDKAIRGGIPLCWPWFGPHPTDQTKPAHGFVRTRPWTTLGTAVNSSGATEVRLGLKDSDDTHVLWPHAFTLELVVVVGAGLHVSLLIHNPGNTPFTCGGALHTYLNVGDVTAISIDGLDKCTYIDAIDHRRAKTQHGAVTIDSETDRIYQDTTAACIISDPVLGRRVTVAKAGSHSTVVWNPWREKAARLVDMGEEEYSQMVCVEAANALDDSIVVPPGGQHRLETLISSDRRIT